MVIFNSKNGQLANRLWQAAYLISNSVENNYRLVHLGFGEYSNYFSENLIKSEEYGNILIVDYKTTSIKNRIIIRISKILKSINKTLKNKILFITEIHFHSYIERYDISDPIFLSFAKKNMVWIEGWLFIDKTSLLKHSEAIRRIFKPNENYINNVTISVKAKFVNFGIVIGIHLRKGDYAHYRNGVWYYSNEEYKSFMSQLALLPVFKNKRIAFVLCSNENIDVNDFEGYNIILATNHFIEDLYTLSICDYIVGPPSTFSSWASFMGKKPLFHIEDKNKIISENDFVIFEGY